MGDTLAERFQPIAHDITDRAGGGHLLLQLLSLDGWTVVETAADPDPGVRIICEHPIWGTVERSGESAASIAADLLDAALALKHDWRPS